MPVLLNEDAFAFTRKPKFPACRPSSFGPDSLCCFRAVVKQWLPGIIKWTTTWSCMSPPSTVVLSCCQTDLHSCSVFPPEEVHVWDAPLFLRTSSTWPPGIKVVEIQEQSGWEHSRGLDPRVGVLILTHDRRKKKTNVSQWEGDTRRRHRWTGCSCYITLIEHEVSSETFNFPKSI